MSRWSIAMVCTLLFACGGAQSTARIHDGGLLPPAWTPSRYLEVDPAAVGPEDLAGEATWYGPGLQGNRTANGERFDMYTFTAAHRRLPFNTVVRVTRVDDRRSVVVRVNDRGPFGSGRVIDVAWAAAVDLGFVERGHTAVEIDILEWGDGAIYER